MAEQEELRLTVSIDDRATAQLQGLRAQLSSMGSGAQAAGMERMRRQSAEVGVSVGGLSEAMRGMATRAGIVGGVVGAITGKLIDLGSQFVARTTDVKAYSEALLILHRNAQMAGTGAAQFQANVTQMQDKAGVGAEQAAASLSKFSEVQVDLQRVNSKTRNELMAGLKPEDRAGMGRLLLQVSEADVTEAANIVLRGADRIEQALLRRGESPALAAQAAARFKARFNLPEDLPRGFQFERISPEQQARVDARIPAALRHQELLRQEKGLWTEIQGTVSAIILEYGGFNAGLETTNTWAVSINSKLIEWETNLRKAGGVLNLLKENTPAWMKGETVPDTRPRAAPGERPTERDLEERAAAFRAQEAAKAAAEAAARAAAAGTARPPSAPVRRPGLAPSRFGPRPGAPAVSAAPGTEPATEPPAPDQATIDAAAAAEAAAKAEAERLEARRQAQLARRRAAAGATAPTPPPATAPTPPPATAAQRFTGGEVSTDTPLRPFRPDPNFLAGREHDVGTAGGGLEDRRALEANTEALRLLNDVLRTSAPQPPPVSGAAEALGIDAIGTQPQPAWAPPDRGSELVPQQEGRAPAASAFEGGRIGLMGGPAMDQAQAAQAMDTKALDRAAARDVNVNGTGKISVDVRAPAGTNVKAQAGGLFKKTEITRQTQMMPASYGPDAATGIGAAEG